MIKVLILDVDGVLTDGILTYDSEGKEYKSFNVKDGYGIKLALEKGIEVVVVSGRSSFAVEKRCGELGVKYLFQNVENKLETVESFLKERGFSWGDAAAMGDDIPDLPVLEKVAVSGAPSDAVEEVKRVVDFVSVREGGKGAVREFIEYIFGLSG